MKREKEYIARSGILPNEEQTKLLKACLHNSHKSNEAFCEWLDLINIPLNNNIHLSSLGLPQFFDTLDLGSQRLLSLLYKKLKINHAQHPIVSKLEGYYKYVWYRNQILVAEFRKLAELLFEQKIKVLPRKGLYMTLMVYKDFGTRPTFDLDITVRKEDWLKTVLILKNHGWISKCKMEPSKINLSLDHAFTFIKGDLELDLHYDFENYFLKKQTKGQMWSDLVMEDKFNYLSKPNELYLTLIHGFMPNDIISSIRWVVDCVLLFRQFNESDWNDFYYLISMERKKSILIMLDYLRGNEFISFPKSINEQLNQLENTQLDLLERTILTFSSKIGGGFRYICAASFISSSKSPRKSIKLLFNHYQYNWDKKSYLDVVFHAIIILPEKLLNLNKRVLDKEKKAQTNIVY